MLPNQQSKFRIRKWVEISDDSHGTYNISHLIRFKTSMKRSNLCDYCDAYISVKGPLTVASTGTATALDNIAKKVIFINCASFMNCISQINNTEVVNAHGIDVVIPMSNLIEYSDNYSKTSASLWKYYRDETVLDITNNFIEFPADNNNNNNNNNNILFKGKIAAITRNSGTKGLGIMVPLKYLNNFWRALEISLINCEISLMLTWSKNCFLVANSFLVPTQIKSQNFL